MGEIKWQLQNLDNNSSIRIVKQNSNLMIWRMEMSNKKYVAVEDVLRTISFHELFKDMDDVIDSAGREYIDIIESLPPMPVREIIKGEWIRVKDGLPKEWQRENGEPIEFNVMLRGAKEATTLCFNGSQWFEFDWKNMKVVGYYTVTHWMPLPEPPKEEMV